MAAKNKILYFVKGSMPTAEDRKAAAALGTKMFRNGTVDGFLEVCTAVAGAVPQRYIRAGYKVVKPELKPETPVPAQAAPIPAQSQSPKLTTIPPPPPGAPWSR